MKKIIIALMFLGLLPVLANAQEVKGEKRIFTITGYYSPLPGQDFYITGDYWSEIRLNGQGIQGADGTPVYPGMIAAPTSYSFGTKISIPGLGVGQVNDRGGAIVEQGQRDLAKHDRLDVWMGYGDAGLLRALSWGVQHLECEIFSADSSIPVGMDFHVPPMLNQILNLPRRRNFEQNLTRGIRGDQVASLQRALKILGFYDGWEDGVFGIETEKAVLAFQKKYFILEGKEDFGAGVFGPQTRDKLSIELYRLEVEEKIREAWEKFHFEENIQRGNRNQAVLKLQQILVQGEFMDVTPTGYFGTQTESALVKFQLAHGLIKTANSNGAGKVGPLTRTKLNEILTDQKEFLAQEKDEIHSYQLAQNKLSYFAHKNQGLGSSLVQK
ncbi:peptidoglycan-binding protein [Candidatus Gracilibacteria bacterium]|nr:peptidoglycan-binding protein [Candidatus Gracilibacteria bacterium]